MFTTFSVTKSLIMLLQIATKGFIRHHGGLSRVVMRGAWRDRCLQRVCSMSTASDKVLASSMQDVNIPVMNLAHLILDQSGKYGNKTALINGVTGQQTSYDQFKDQVWKVASALVKMGLGKGDVLTMFSPNCPEFAIMYIAVAAIGATVSAVNPLYTVGLVVSLPSRTCAVEHALCLAEHARQEEEALSIGKGGRELTGPVVTALPLKPEDMSEEQGLVIRFLDGELSHALTHSEAKILVTVPSLLPVAKQAVANSPFIKRIISFGSAEGCQPFSSLLEDDGKSFPENVEVDVKNDIVALPYSSGTTGLPKGVELTHYNIGANILQLVSEDVMSYKSSDVLSGVLPFFHIYGQTVVMLTALYAGASVVTLPKFDPELYLKACQENRVTFMHVVPPIALFLAKHPLVEKYNFNAVHTLFVGAAPVGEETLEAALERVNPSAVFRQGYGLTEASPVTHCNPKPPGKILHNSIGNLIHNTLGKIQHVETGAALNAGEEGELLVQGPQIMKGYFKNPEATADTIDAHGWLHTGDIGYYDKNGYFYITDRLKELIKYKGYQVAPAELEALLVSHPKIQDAAVIGVPDERAGELPRAYVVLNKDTMISEDNIHDFVKDKVAPYKQLTGGIIFLSEIPKSATGKILRRKLKEQL